MMNIPLYLNKTTHRQAVIYMEEKGGFRVESLSNSIYVEAHLVTSSRILKLNVYVTLLSAGMKGTMEEDART